MSTRPTQRPQNRLFFLACDNQVNLFWFISLFWSNCIEKCLVLQKEHHSASRHKKRLLVSFCGGFLNLFPPNCNWITQKNHTQTSLNKPVKLKTRMPTDWMHFVMNWVSWNPSCRSKFKQSVVDDVNTVSSKQPNPGSSPCKYFSGGSATHLQSQRSRTSQDRGQNRGRFYHSGSRPQVGRAQNSITCYNCGDLGHVASQCSSPHLN